MSGRQSSCSTWSSAARSPRNWIGRPAALDFAADLVVADKLARPAARLEQRGEHVDRRGVVVSCSISRWSVVIMVRSVPAVPACVDAPSGRRPTIAANPRRCAKLDKSVHKVWKRVGARSAHFADSASTACPAGLVQTKAPSTSSPAQLATNALAAAWAFERTGQQAVGLAPGADIGLLAAGTAAAPRAPSGASRSRARPCRGRSRPGPRSGSDGWRRGRLGRLGLGRAAASRRWRGVDRRRDRRPAPKLTAIGGMRARAPRSANAAPDRLGRGAGGSGGSGRRRPRLRCEGLTCARAGPRPGARIAPAWSRRTASARCGAGSDVSRRPASPRGSGRGADARTTRRLGGRGRCGPEASADAGLRRRRLAAAATRRRAAACGVAPPAPPRWRDLPLAPAARFAERLAAGHQRDRRRTRPRGDAAMTATRGSSRPICAARGKMPKIGRRRLLRAGQPRHVAQDRAPSPSARSRGSDRRWRSSPPRRSRRGSPARRRGCASRPGRCARSSGSSVASAALAGRRRSPG